jgi:predicted transglutaminase-like cysteine proteinase
MKAAVIALLAVLGAHQCPPDRLPSFPFAVPDFDRHQGLDASDLVGFCRRKPHAVLCQGREGKLLTFAEVKEIDLAYRKIYQYRDDDLLYHVDDFYNAPVRCGDCEDYSLTMSELLADQGEAGGFMDLVLLLDCDQQGCEGHAKLWVVTADRGMIELGNDQAPHDIWWKSPEDVREGLVPMDGKRRLIAFPDYYVVNHQVGPR